MHQTSASTVQITDAALRAQLAERHQTVELEIARVGHTPELDSLLTDVRDAVARADGGSFGICESCHEPIEADRLMIDPLVRFCLDHLTAAEQRALERDLDLAAQIQRGSCPRPWRDPDAGKSATGTSRRASSAATTATTSSPTEATCTS